MYTGPTNGGVGPLDNSSWPDWQDSSGAWRHQCPLSATHMGLDGRTIRGHVDDYWVEYGDPGPDPFIGNWPEHTYGDCAGDYMKTNQSSHGNADGSTTIYTLYNGSALHWDDMETYGIADEDGGYGLKLFYESRGYTVTEMYNQCVLGYAHPARGFTYEQYKAEIDAGRPVMIHLEGHTMVGVGYDDSGDLMYVHDTWDYAVHTMTWGGTYVGMRHYAVTIAQLAPLTVPLVAPSDLAAAAVGADQIDLTWTDNSADETAFHVERSPNGTTAWVEVETVPADATSYGDAALACATTYHYRVRAYRSGDDAYSGYSNAASDATDPCPPAAPTGLAATAASQTQIDLTWTDNASDETAFHVERSPDGTTGWAEVATVPADATSYSDAALACGTTYHYRVRAYRSGDDAYSGYSETATAVTPVYYKVFLPVVLSQLQQQSFPTHERADVAHMPGLPGHCPSTGTTH